MPRIPIHRLSPGWYVLNPVCDDRGNLLLGPGVQIKDYFIERLQDLGLPAIDVTLAPDSGAAAAGLLTAETRSRTMRFLTRTLDSIRAGAGWNPAELDGCVHSVVREVSRNTDTLLGLTDIRAARGYLYAHSVNVCTLAVLIGRDMGYPFEDLVALGTGALLHDVGLVFAGSGHRGRWGPYALSTSFRRKHPRLGYQALLAQGAINPRAARVAFEHHEALDGSGYPAGAKGSRISEFGQIAAVADTYDILSSDHSHRAGLTPARCVAVLHSLAASRLAPGAVAALVSNLAMYPVGTLVRLSTGLIGMVVGFDRSNLHRPEVRLAFDEAWEPVSGEVLRLADNPDIQILEQMTAMTYDLTANETAHAGSVAG